MHLFGFIIRIYHDARSSECQIQLVDVTSHSNLMEYRKLMSVCDIEGVPARPSLLQNADGGLGKCKHAE